MEEILKALRNDPQLDQIADLLYGDGAYEVVKALTPEQKKQRKDKVMQNVALGTNAVGSVAGPAALGLAWRSRKEGGTPRAYAPNVSSAMKKTKRFKKTGEKIDRAVGALNNPKSKRAKIAAGVAGGTLVGLQGVNWTGDMLSTKIINDQKKKDAAAKVSKSDHESIKFRLVKAGHGKAFEEARKAPRRKAQARALKAKVKDKTQDIRVTGEIAKRDNDKRQVFGWASVIEIDGKPFIDYQGDMMDLETVENAAYEYVQKSRKGGNQHQRNGDEPLHVSDLVESFVLTPEKKEQMGLPEDSPTGWWVGFKVNDDETWQDVKDGKLTEFSIHGKGTRKSYEAAE